MCFFILLMAPGEWSFGGSGERIDSDEYATLIERWNTAVSNI